MGKSVATLLCFLLVLLRGADGQSAPRQLRGMAVADGSEPGDIFSVQNNTFRASDAADIGYVVVSRGATVVSPPGSDSNASNASTVLIAPGLTGTATGFAEWFAGALLRVAHGVRQVVVMDYRGYGLSTGPWTASAPPEGAAAPGYGGLSTWRLAQDLGELADRIRDGPDEQLLLLGHSMGVNVVLQLLELRGADFASGLALLDDSPKNMDWMPGVDIVADASFPQGLITFTPAQMAQWDHKYVAFDDSVDLPEDVSTLNLTELGGPWQPYYELDAALLEQFYAADMGNISTQTRPAYMTQTTEGLLAWMRHLGASNGKVMALMVLSSMQQGLTGAAAKIREARVPFFWSAASKAS